MISINLDEFGTVQLANVPTAALLDEIRRRNLVFKISDQRTVVKSIWNEPNSIARTVVQNQLRHDITRALLELLPKKVTTEETESLIYIHTEMEILKP